MGVFAVAPPNNSFPLSTPVMLSNLLIQLPVAVIERGYCPDRLTRSAIRYLLGQRLRDLQQQSKLTPDAQQRFVSSLNEGPLALVPDKANEQHYELPPEFFEQMLGPRRKYSSCYWSEADGDLPQAEETSLRSTCENAELEDGHSLLELGCGWGALSLWVAEHFPQCRITAVSNSAEQRGFIERAADQAGYSDRLRVVTADMNDFTTEETYDRVISVEMFEHMHNYRLLLQRIANWLEPDGKLLVHHFCHRSWAYPFETQGASNWMGRYFFSGGLMPNADLLQSFSSHLSVARSWNWNGEHYSRTLDAWLAELDCHKARVMPILENVYGTDASRWFQRWRMFLMACSELFGYRGGQEWSVSHHQLVHSDSETDAPHG